MINGNKNEWKEYYSHFPYFSFDNIRSGCQPRILTHTSAAKKAVILVHGLSDSPYFMAAIGEYFFSVLGYDVYIPLLQGHGLKDPKGMEGVSLAEWKANVDFAVRTASAKSAEISVGGLSTGGALSLHAALDSAHINGTVYLFSAALDLAGGPAGLIGEIKERLLRTVLADLLDSNRSLIGENPYRYDRIDMDGAQELAKLIKELDDKLVCFSNNHPIPRKIFAAHSECDNTADIAGIEQLQKLSAAEAFTLFRIPKSAQVAHASVVLKESISVNGKILEKANPCFQDMMQAIAAFSKTVVVK